LTAGRPANHTAWAEPTTPILKSEQVSRAVNAASRQPAKGVAYVHRDHFDLLFA
jgi:hypothetical protein